MSQAADSRVKTVSGYQAGYPAATVTSRQAETLSLSVAAWHWLALPGSAATAATRSCSLQPRLSRLPIMMSGHWALGCGHWAVGIGHLWAVGTQDRRATAVKVLTQTPHETGRRARVRVPRSWGQMPPEPARLRRELGGPGPLSGAQMTQLAAADC